ncbi:MAG: 4Fe-4S binding protein [Proteobacteria bacterium]|nr:4Fe-4S binding protein [Pseudomonadota bacterium]
MIKIIRRLSQILAIFFILAVPYLNDRQINIIMGNLYASSIFGIEISDPLIFLQNVILNLSFDFKFFLSIIIPLVLAITFGRVFCSFLCPVNTVFEFLNKIYPRKKLIQIKGDYKASLILFSILIILIFITEHPLFNYLSLPGLLSVELQKLFISKSPSLFWGLFVFLILIDYIIRRRFWCNYLCPQGIFIGFLKIKKTLQVVKEVDKVIKCLGCKRCVTSCPFYLNPMEEKIYPQCTNCFECVLVCRKNHKDQAPLKIKF